MMSQKPYLIRALYEWCMDNNFTPHLMNFVDESTIVPQKFVQENKIVLNIAPHSVKDLIIGNSWITFKATFSGVIQDVCIPISNVLAIFSQENGQGMQFKLEQASSKLPAEKNPNISASNLKLVK